MKDFTKIFGIMFFGLLTATLIYPILHEVGHSAIAVLVGAKVKDFNIFPLPSVACDIFEISDIGIIAIGLGGNLVPYLISFLLKPKSFWGWYTNSIVRGICLLATTISAVSVILWLNGITVKNEDVVQILNTVSSDASVFVILFTIMLIYGIKQITVDKPFKKICKYFNI